MADRIPLIVNPDAAQIQELPAGDTLAVDGLSLITATADGTIAANAAVTLTSAGKAKAISTVAESHGSAGTFYTHSGSVRMKAINFAHWDTSQNAAIINWADTDDNRMTSVGTLSGSTITWASPINQFGTFMTHAIASNKEGGGIITRKTGSTANLQYQTFTLSGNTMTLGTVVDLSNHATNSNAPDRHYLEYLEKDGSSHYFAQSYRWGWDTTGTGMVAKVRIMKWDGQNNVTLGTETSLGSVVTSNAARTAIYPRLIGLENGRFLVYDSGLYKVCTRVGTSFRLPSNGHTLLGATPPEQKAPVYDPRTKYLLTVDANEGASASAIHIYIVDGENINYRFKVDLPVGHVGNGHVEMTDKGQILFSYIDSTGGGLHNGKQLLGTFNDAKDDVTWGSPTTWSTAASNMGVQPRIVKADDGKVIQLFYTGTGGVHAQDGKSVVSQTPTTTLTEDNFLGFSSAGYSNNDAARIKVLGNTTTKSGLTIGKKYYVQDDGTLATSKGSFGVVAGKAVSATSLLITPV